MEHGRPPDTVGERYVEMRNRVTVETAEDVEPLLAKKGGDPEGQQAEEQEAFAATTLVYPLPSASYTCSERSWASKLFFSWVNPVLEKDGDLQLNDVFFLPSDLNAATLSERFEIAWIAAMRGDHPSIASTFYALFARDFWVAGVFRLVTELCKISSPMILREVILYAQGESEVVPNSLFGGLALASLMFFVVLLQACTLQQFIHGVFVVGAGVNTAATTAVYNKSLRLSRASLEGSRLGQTLNLQAKDASKLREAVVFFHNLWAAPATAGLSTILLLYVLGPSALVGVCTIPILIPLETWVARRSATYRKRVLTVADARVSLIGEVIDGMKTVKLNSLDAAFRARVEALRVEELASIRHALTLNACNQAVMRSSPIVVALATFAAYTFAGGRLNAAVAFPALALFHVIAHPFHVMPKAIQLFADAKVSLERLQAFLLEREAPRSTAHSALGSGRYRTASPRVVMEDVSFQPVEGRNCLEHVTAEMNRGLSILVGPIGCGKTTLLLGLVEHLPSDGNRGVIKIETSDNRVALCPDTPWIVNASARENICLGSQTEFDDMLYRKCVGACALEQDFTEWPEGDATVLGEKGITISGGQQARISLCRAMYAECDVVLLDDPLAALDTIVGSWVFKHAVREMATHAAVIMATHQQQYLEDDCSIFALDQGRLQPLGDVGALLGGGVASPATGEKCINGCVLDDTQLPGLVNGLVKSLEPAGVACVSTAKLKDSANQVNRMAQLSAKVDTDRVKGGVAKTVYIDYLKACGILVVAVALAISVLAQFVDVSKEIILAFWSDSSSERSAFYLSWYSGVCILVVIMNLVRFFVVCWLGLRGSEALHKSLVLKVMGAPLTFFQATERGRITSRFSSDFNAIDLVIPSSISSIMDAILSMLAAVFMIVGTSPAFLVVILPAAIAYNHIQSTYRASAKELKRLDSASKSPIYSHFQETLDGLPCIQAYRIELNMKRKNFFLVDANMRARLTWDATNRWLGIRLDCLGALVVFIATLMAIVARRTSPGMVGLGLSYALTITRTLSFGVRSSTALENQFNSVERVQEFINLEQEAERGLDVPNLWPCKGIEMRHVYARHRPDLPAVLNGVSLSVRCGERVGICGRSGSGKSSLALALVRVVECFEGSITVDGLDIKEVPLSMLRSAVTVISQDAHLFSGTVREVIDPLGQCSDARIWDIIKMVGLMTTVADLPLGLLTSVSERGGNWSAGQRQLLCIARAMVNQPGVLVFDEATANVDAQTNGIIQQLIQRYLNSVAVIVIAHRLEDVLSCHRVVVMDAGLVADEGEPLQLLNDDSSMLSRLVRELGPNLEYKLRKEHTLSR